MNRRVHRPREDARRPATAACLGWGLVLVILAAACAPSTEPVGTVSLEDEPVHIRAGTALRVVTTFGYGDLDLQPGDLRPLPLPEILVEPRENVTTAFVLRDVQAPDGWSVRLDEVERVIEPLDGGGRAYRVDVALRIAVPGDAVPGSYRVSATVRAPGAGQRTISVEVIVPASQAAEAAPAYKDRSG